MGTTGSAALLGLAATLAVVHTAIGVDHALPFVVLARVQGWTTRRALWVTFWCGVGHVVSALAIGLGAVALGIAAERLQWVDEVRGDVALGLLVALGLAYAAVGAVRLWKRRPHRHAHVHEDGTLHDHDHGHRDEHAHLHGAARERVASAWALFVVLVFGPCEALVPLLLAPGVLQDWALLAGVVATFGALTVATMLVLVWLGLQGARWVDLERRLGPRFAPASEVAAGLAIAATGVAVGALGL